jgi:hypothetical protein
LLLESSIITGLEILIHEFDNARAVNAGESISSPSEDVGLDLEGSDDTQVSVLR